MSKVERIELTQEERLLLLAGLRELEDLRYTKRTLSDVEYYKIQELKTKLSVLL